jgi:L-fuculose-phosphate aldolase
MPDDDVRARASNEIAAHLKRPDRDDREALALAARILAADGHSSGLAGQVTVRAAAGGYWTLPLGVGFDEATADAILRVDDDIRTLEGPGEGMGIANPAVRFHAWIYRARPDVRCIVHTHPPAASALSMTGRPLVAAHMDAMMLYDDCAFLAEWPGVPIADDEGRIISEALGDKRAILLAHHGLLTAGATIEEAAYLAYFMERAARLQLDAEAVGPIRPVEPEFGRAAHDFLLKPEIVAATFDYLARRLDRR